MTLQLELWQLITLLVAFLGACGAAGKLVLSQMQRHIDQLFAAQDLLFKTGNQETQRRLADIEKATRDDAGQWRHVERQLDSLKADLPLRFVMREDYIRGQSVIESKIDALASLWQNHLLRNNKGDAA